MNKLVVANCPATAREESSGWSCVIPLSPNHCPFFISDGQNGIRAHFDHRHIISEMCGRKK